MGFKTYQRQKVPKYIKDQENRAKQGCIKLYDKLHADVTLIIDDETYVQQDPEQLNSNQYYRAKPKDDIDDMYGFKPKQQISKKTFLI